MRRSRGEAWCQLVTRGDGLSLMGRMGRGSAERSQGRAGATIHEDILMQGDNGPFRGYRPRLWNSAIVTKPTKCVHNLLCTCVGWLIDSILFQSWCWRLSQMCERQLTLFCVLIVDREATDIPLSVFASCFGKSGSRRSMRAVSIPQAFGQKRSR